MPTTKILIFLPALFLSTSANALAVTEEVVVCNNCNISQMERVDHDAVKQLRWDIHVPPSLRHHP